MGILPCRQVSPDNLVLCHFSVTRIIPFGHRVHQACNVHGLAKGSDSAGNRGKRLD